MSACIWYISKYVIPPSLGSVGTRGFFLLREMARLGHRAVIVTSDSNHLNPTPKLDGAQMTEVVDGVTLRWLRTHKYSAAQSLGRIVSWLDFEWRLWRMRKDDLPRPDVVIVSSLSLLTIVNGLLLRRRYRCRLVFEVRDIWPLTIIEEGGFSARNPFVMALRWMEKLAYRRADLVVGTMPNLKQHVDESLGERHAPVAFIPFGIAPDMISAREPLPDGWADRHVPNGKFVICHAGTIGVTNALEVLFDCARRMKDMPDVHFLIVGDGYLRTKFQKECANLPNVTFTGPVNKAQVQSVLELCDLLYFSVLPSKVWTYGASLNKNIDYMLSGKPILASYTGHPTMVEEAGAGRFVPAGDVEALQAEILRLAATSPAELKAMGEKGRRWLLEHRTYAALALEYLHLMLPELGAGAEPESVATPQRALAS